jgi:hypothetical protein
MNTENQGQIPSFESPTEKEQPYEKTLATESTVHDSAMTPEKESQLSRFALSSFLQRQGEQPQTRDQMQTAMDLMTSLSS